MEKKEKDGMQQHREKQQEDRELLSPEDPSEKENEPDSQKQLEQAASAEHRAQEYLDLLQRTRADFINYRRRMNQASEETRIAAQRDLLYQLLPVLNDFERALETIPSEQAEKPWVQGLFLIARRLTTVLDQSGVRSLGALNEPFDPHWHEALEMEARPDVPEGTILQVVQPGYALGDKVIRPAQVVVATSPVQTNSAPEKPVDV